MFKLAPCTSIGMKHIRYAVFLEVNEEESQRNVRRMLSHALGHVMCRKNLWVTVAQQRHNQVNELDTIMTSLSQTKLTCVMNSFGH